MESLFEPTAVTEITNRMGRLRPDSAPQWGKMNVAQMLAHCSAAIGMAEGSVTPPRILLGRLLVHWPRNRSSGRASPCAETR